MDFVCRVTAGLEEIAALDLEERLPEIELLETGWRRVRFRLEEHVGRVKDLRSVDDVYLHVAELNEVGRTRDEIERCKAAVRDLDYGAILRDRERCGPLELEEQTFYLTVSRLGDHNFSSAELRSSLTEGISAAAGWSPVEKYDRAEVNFRVILEYDNLFIGMSAADRPLQRRAYRACHLPGALKPPVAYLLCRIAGIDSGDTFLDPMCGTGTIPIEAKILSRGSMVSGSDVSTEALRCAGQNWRRAFPEAAPNLVAADIARHPFPADTVTKMVSNPPWGRQVEIEDAGDTYRQILQLFETTGAPAGVCVLITDRVQALMATVQESSRVALLWVRQISLYGAYPVVCVLGGPDWIGKEQGALERISPLGEGISRLIRKQGIWQAYSKLPQS